MEYTQKEREIAQSIIQNEDYCALLTKVLLSTEESLTIEVVREKTNAELGEIVRANEIAKEKIKSRWDKLKQLGQINSGKINKIPR